MSTGTSQPDPWADDGRRYNSFCIAPAEHGLWTASFGLCAHRIAPGDRDDVERAAVAHANACPPGQPVQVAARSVTRLLGDAVRRPL